MTFDPNAAAALDAGIYGLPCSADEAQMIIIPVEWELTTSYNRGTVDGPQAVFDGSMQVDLCNHDYPDLWEKGIWMDSFPEELRALHERLAPVSQEIIEAIENGEDTDTTEFKKKYVMIEEGFETMFDWLRKRIAFWRNKGKKVGLLGGDHSIPLAYHQYLNEKNEEYGILHVDAHNDLREQFEGFKYSHASIFFNTMKFQNVTRLVQVGIRDYCHQEKAMVHDSEGRIKVFYDRDCRKRLFEGEKFKDLVKDIVESLPQKVYISFDIDGLDPKLCPNTGTPVPGGFDYEEMMYLLNEVKHSGREVVGFDLCEVSPGEGTEWDGNVGARVLYQLIGVCC